jgi:hypothetical protein
MSTSGSGSGGDILARAQVAIAADLTAFDAAMDQLPGKARKKIDAAMATIKAEMDAVKLQIPIHAGNPAAVKQLTDYMAQLATQMDHVKMSAIGQAQAMSQVASATKAAGVAASGGMKNMGMAALEGSRALEDLQYGIAGVLNNIPGLVMSMGGSAGLTAAISVAAVAATQLYKHWDELATLFGQGATKTEAEQMKELAENTKRTADEEERYQKLKERAKHGEAQEGPPDQKTGFGRAVDDAIKNGPLKEFEKGLE